MSDDIDETAIHEAGHTILFLALGIGVKDVTIDRDIQDMSEGATRHGGSGVMDADAENLKFYAEDSYWLRLAICAFAGAEAIRQLRPQLDAHRGAGGDFQSANEYITSISNEPEIVDHYFAIAKLRSAVLVKNYAPEIEALATALKDRRSMSGKEVAMVFENSLDARSGRRISW